MGTIISRSFEERRKQEMGPQLEGSIGSTELYFYFFFRLDNSTSVG